MDNYSNAFCAVILTALPIEYQAVRAHVTDLQEEIHPEGTIYERGTFSSGNQKWEIGLVETRMGTARAAFEAGRAIDYFKPSLVLFVGVAGGIKDVKIGDIVAATKVYTYESGKAERTFHPRPEIGNSTYRMVHRAQTEARNGHWIQRIKPTPFFVPQPRAYVGPIAAGEKVLASSRAEIWNFLKHYYGDALAVEMEGSGFLQAMYGNQHIGALIIRGISDLIDRKSETDKAGSQEIAAHHASAFAFEVLAKVNSDQKTHQSKNTKPSRKTEDSERMAPSHSKYNTQINGDIRHFIQGDNPSVNISKQDQRDKEG